MRRERERAREGGREGGERHPGGGVWRAPKGELHWFSGVATVSRSTTRVTSHSASPVPAVVPVRYVTSV